MEFIIYGTCIKSFISINNVFIFLYYVQYPFNFSPSKVACAPNRMSTLILEWQPYFMRPISFFINKPVKIFDFRITGRLWQDKCSIRRKPLSLFCQMLKEKNFFRDKLGSKNLDYRRNLSFSTYWVFSLL